MFPSIVRKAPTFQWIGRIIIFRRLFLAFTSTVLTIILSQFWSFLETLCKLLLVAWQSVCESAHVVFDNPDCIIEVYNLLSTIQIVCVSNLSKSTALASTGLSRQGLHRGLPRSVPTDIITRPFTAKGLQPQACKFIRQAVPLLGETATTVTWRTATYQPP